MALASPANELVDLSAQGGEVDRIRAHLHQLTKADSGRKHVRSA
jgi:hypothetical protein